MTKFWKKSFSVPSGCGVSYRNSAERIFGDTAKLAYQEFCSVYAPELEYATEAFLAGAFPATVAAKLDTFYRLRPCAIRRVTREALSRVPITLAG